MEPGRFSSASSSCLCGGHAQGGAYVFLAGSLVGISAPSFFRLLVAGIPRRITNLVGAEEAEAVGQNSATGVN